MKKLAAILLLGMLLFNGGGYRMLTSLMENQANDRLDAQLDNDRYDDSQLFSIKIPVTNLAYCNNSLQYERVYGEIEANGIHYKYCKRRIFNDSLELLCIPDLAAMQFQTAKDNFFRTMNDLPQQGQAKTPWSRPHRRHYSGDDYTLDHKLSVAHPVALFAETFQPKNIHIISRYAVTPDQPPEVMG